MFSQASNFLINLKPENVTKDEYFYISPERHVKEFIGMNLIAFILYNVSFLLRKKMGKFDQLYETLPPLKLNWFEKLLRNSLLLCFIQQVFYKTYRGNYTVLYMLQPCHINALALFMFTYLKQTKTTLMCLLVTLQFSLLTVLAIISPDLTPLKLPLEQFFFWVEHYLLLIYPLVLLFNPTVIKLGQKDRNWIFLLSFGFALFIYFGIQTVTSLISGININYTLFPPPNPVEHILASEAYRINFSLIVGGVIAFCSFVFIPLLNSISTKLHHYKFKNDQMIINK